MTKTAFAVLAVASLALTACGSSDSANEAASPDNVEMPAEEAVGGVDAAATPVADPAATASGAVDPAASSAAPAEAAPVATESATPAPPAK